MVDYEESICASKNVDCIDLGNGLYAICEQSKFGNNRNVRIWQDNGNDGQYLDVKGKITGEDFTNLVLNSKNYALNINYNKKEITVIEREAEEPYVQYHLSGTYYEANINNKKIIAIAVGSVVVGLIAGGVVLYFSKNPNVAGMATSETAEIVGGTVAKEVIKHTFDRLASVALVTLLSSEQAKAFNSLFQEAQSIPAVYRDPMLIDLNGDGIKTTTIENGTYFDHDNNGYAEKTGWVDENDGIFVYDKNNNGIIENGTEVLGDSFIKSDGTTAANGFEALKSFDSNNDNVINASDEEFANIKILKGDGTHLTLLVA